jgi:hypothetical protein
VPEFGIHTAPERMSVKPVEAQAGRETPRLRAAGTRVIAADHLVLVGQTSRLDHV